MLNIAKGIRAKIWVPGIAITLALLSIILPAPPLEAYNAPLSGVHCIYLRGAPGTSSYVDIWFDETITEPPTGPPLSGWCLAEKVAIVPGAWYCNTTVYDIFDLDHDGTLSWNQTAINELPAHMQSSQIHWHAVAWILNNKVGTWQDIQCALWHHSAPLNLDPPFDTLSPTSMANYNAMIAGGDTAEAEVYVPPANGVRPVAADPNPAEQLAKQLVIYEYGISMYTTLSPVSPPPPGSVTDTVTVMGQPNTPTGNVTFQVSTDFGASWNATVFTPNPVALTPGSGLSTATSSSYTVSNAVTDWRAYTDSEYSNLATAPFNAANHIVYMRGSGFAVSSHYTVAWYDAAGVKQQTNADITPEAGGVLKSLCDLSSHPLAAAGVWHAVVYDNQDTPSETYNANDTNIMSNFTNIQFRVLYSGGNYNAATSNEGIEVLRINSDGSFQVNEDSLPEFPTPVATLFVTGVCGGTYWWMRKRRTTRAFRMK